MYNLPKILTIIFCILQISAAGQSYLNLDQTSRPYIEDSTVTAPKNGLRTTALILGTNTSVWAFDRYVVRGPYAYISLKTMKQNFSTGFVWDNDMFSTNLFAHPYHGGTYFNAARSNGMNFWQSVPFAAGGSLLWEFLMENEPAAINDFIATSIGGSCLGEITYRISDRIIDDRTSGFERFKREALLTLISPIRGLNRIINGDAHRHRNIRGNALPWTPVSFYVSGGWRLITDNSLHNNDISTMACYDLGLSYGSPFDPDNEKPYDFFSLRMSGNILSQQPIISRFNAIGELFSTDVTLGKGQRKLALGIFQHFNFYQANIDINNTFLNPYKISEAASLGPGFLYKSNKIKNINFTCSGHLSAILLGGSQTDHFKYDKRDYNMGSGFSSKLNLALELDKKMKITLNSEDYRLYSWVGNNPANQTSFTPNVQGDIGNAGLSVFILNAEYRLGKHLLVSGETGYYYRKSNYKYYPDVIHRSTSHRICLGYLF